MAIVRKTFIVLYGLAFCEEPSSFVSNNHPLGQKQREISCSNLSPGDGLMPSNATPCCAISGELLSLSGPVSLLK